MLKKLHLLAIVIVCSLHANAYSVIDYAPGRIIYCDEELHLQFMLNTETKEAMLGNGIDVNHNALYSPPLGDPWWDTMENLWGNIVVPEYIEYDGNRYSVTSVAPNAFYKSTEVHKIQLPGTIRSIGGSAFAYCTYLTKVNVPEGVDIIGSYTFYCCKKMAELHLPSTIRSIGYAAFLDCQALTSFNIPGNCTSIANDAFSYCLGLTNLTFEDGDEPISLGYAYEFGPDWSSYAEPYYYRQRTWRGMFNDCNLKHLYIGRDIQISEPLVENYSPFERIRQTTDSNDKTTTYHINGQWLNNVEFGDCVTRIPNNLFKYVTIDNIVSLPQNVISIGDNAFRNSLKQNKLVIPAACTYIGEYAFSSSDTYGPIVEVECQSVEPPTTATTAFYSNSFHVTVPNGARGIYSDHDYWGKYFICDPADQLITVDVKYPGSLYGRLIFQDVEPIDVYRLKVKGTLNEDDWNVLKSMSKIYELDLTEVTLENLNEIKDLLRHVRIFGFPETITEIPANFFYEAHLTGTVRIPKSCTKIGAFAFWKSNIQELIIDGPTVVEEKAFSFCQNLSQVSIRGEGACVKKQAFWNVLDLNVKGSGLKRLTLGDGVTIERDGFESCESLKELIIDGDVKSMSPSGYVKLATVVINKKFSYCDLGTMTSELEEIHVNDIASWVSSHGIGLSSANNVYFNGNIPDEIVIPEGVQIISNGFGGLSTLTKVTLPEGLTKIGVGAFRDCVNLREINMPSSINVLDASVFYGCKSLQDVMLPSSVTEIGASAFNGCTSLYEMTLPQNLEIVPSSIFEGCTSLSKVTLPKAVKTIGGRAFEGCVSLTDLEIPNTVESIGESAFKGCTGITSINLPSSLNTLSGHAFENCSAIKEMKLPYALKNIGEMVFSGCSELRTIDALWISPMEVAPTAFNNISKKCILYVPIGSVPTYYEKGWGHIPLIDERENVFIIKSNSGGAVYYGDKKIDDVEAFWVTPDDNVSIQLCPKENYYAQSYIHNGEERKLGLNEYTFTYNNMDISHEIEVKFKIYVPGDVNDDNYIDVGDITAIVRYIQQSCPEDDLVVAAADVNKDENIDVGDIVATVNTIYEDANKAIGAKCRNCMGNDSNHSSLFVSQSSAINNNSTFEVPVSLKGDCDICGVQMEIAVPDGFSIPLDENGNLLVGFNKDRVKNMNISSIVKLPNGNYQILLASTENGKLENSTDELFTLSLHRGDRIEINDNSELQIIDIRIATPEAHVEYLSPVSFLLDTVSTSINLSSEETLPSFKKYLKNGMILINHNGKNYTIKGTEITQ